MSGWKSPVRAVFPLGLALLIAFVGYCAREPGHRAAGERSRRSGFETRVARIEPGLTSPEQARRWFGEPASVTVFADGSVL